MTPHPASTDESLSLKEYVFLREEIRHQDNLVNARLSWLVSSQSFSLSGFAVTLNGSAQSVHPLYAKLNVTLVAFLPVAGIVTNVASYLTIWAAIFRMSRIRRVAGNSHPSHFLSVTSRLLHGAGLCRASPDTAGFPRGLAGDHCRAAVVMIVEKPPHTPLVVEQGSPGALEVRLSGNSREQTEAPSAQVVSDALSQAVGCPFNPRNPTSFEKAHGWLIPTAQMRSAE
jgi:hypothetical protein